MSRSIDNAIVSMQFDNKGFESNVQTSLGTIDKLKSSLSSLGSTKALDNLSSSAKHFNLSPVSSAAQSVGLKFNAMYTMADAALRNIVNSAMNAGKRIASALTIDPIKSGFQEYETQINAVQTILANTESKGTTLTDVNAALDELNTYADKTIYNFTEMTKNIGTFTAAGIDLDKAVNSIKGIANLAAVSGSTSQQASTAMYQLSQALASGTVKLMDWNSVVNAGMGGQVFQDALKETARVHGVAIDEMIKKEGSFRETLQNGWLTSDILTETLNKFTLASEEMTEAEVKQNRERLKSIGYTDAQIDGIFKLGNTATNAATKVKTFTQLMDTLKEAAQSGWTQTWEYIVGDFEQAKSFWTMVSDELGGVIGDSAERRNTMLEGAMTSNWSKLIKQLNEDGVSTQAFEDNLKKVFEGQSRYDLDYLMETYGSYEEIFHKGAAPTDFLIKALSSSNEALTEHKEHVVQAGDTLSGLAKKYGVTVDELVKWNNIKDKNLIIDGDTLKVSNQAITENIGLTNRQIESYKDLIGALKEKSGRELLVESVVNSYQAIKSIVTPITKAYREVFKPITSEQLYGFLEKMRDFTSGLKLDESQMDKLKNTAKGLFSILGIGKDALSGLFKGIAPSFGILTGFGNKVLDVSSFLGNWITNLRETIKESEIFEKAGAKLAEGITKIRTKLSEFGKPIWEWFFGPKGADPGYITGFQQFISDVKTFIDETGAMDYVKEKWDDAKKSVTGFFQGAKTYIDATGITGMIGDKFTSIGQSLKGFFQSVKDEGLNFGEIIDRIKTSITEFVKGLSLDKIKKAFAGFKDTIKLNLEASGINFDSFKEKLSGFADFIKSIVPAILGVVSGILMFKGIFAVWNVVKGVVGLITGFADGLKGLMEAKQNYLNAEATAKKLDAISGIIKSLALLAGAIAVLAFVNPPNIWTAVGAISALLAAVALVAGLMSALDSLDKTGDASNTILKISGAVLVLAGAVALLGNMDDTTLLKGEFALAGILAMIVGLMAATKLIGDHDIKAFGKLASSLGRALILMSAAVAILGNMDISTIVQGELALAGLLGMLVGMMAATKLIGDKNVKEFGKLMSSLGGALLLMAAAVAILGNMDTGTIIKGELAIASMLGMMAGMMAATKKLAAGLPKFGTTMLALSAALIPMTLAIAILGNMDTGTIVKGELAIAGIMAMFAGMMAATKLLASGTDIAKFSVTMLAFSGAMLILAGAIGILSLLSPTDIAMATGAVVAVGGMFIGLLAVTKMVNVGAMGTLLVMTGAVAVMAGMIYLLATLPVESCLTAALSLTAVLMGVAGALLALGAIPSVALVKGVAAIAIIVAGIAAVAAVVAGVTMALTSGLPKVGENLTAFMDNLGGFMAGAQNIKPEMLDGVKALAETIAILAKANLVDKISSIFGKSALPRFGEQLTPFGEALTGFSESISSITIEDAQKIAEVASAVKILAEAAKTAQTDTKVVGWGAYISVGSLNGFSEWMKSAVPVLGQFATDISAIGHLNIDGINAVVSAAKGLAEAANTAKITDTTALAGLGYTKFESLSGFAAWLKSVIPVLTDFAKDVSFDESGKALKFNAKNITAIVDAAKALAEAANAAKTENVSVLAGLGYIKIDSLSGFSAWLKSVIPILTRFASDVSFAADGKKLPNFNYKNITAITDAAKELAGAAEAAKTEESNALGGLAYVSIELLGGFIGWLKSAIPILTGFANDVSFDKDGKKLPDFNYDNISSVASAAKTLAEAANAAKTQYVEVAGGAYTNVESLGEFKDWLKTATEVMSQFAIELSVDKDGKKRKIDTDAVTKVSESVVTLANAANTAKTTKVEILEGAYTETSELGAFADWLVLALPSISKFAIDLSSVESINTEAVSSVATSAKTLMEAAALAPKKTELDFKIVDIVSSSEIGSFADWISGVTTALSTFAKDLSGEVKIDTNAVTAVSNSGKILAEMANLIPTDGGFFDLFTGETNWDSFGKGITTFGSKMAEFSKSVTGENAVNPEVITSVSNAGLALAQMMSIVQVAGGFGEGDVADFTTNVMAIADVMNKFSGKVAEINVEAITAASGSAQALVNVLTVLLTTSFEKVDTASFSSKCGEIAGAMSSFATSMEGVNITGAASAVSSLVTTLTSLSSANFGGVDSLKGAIESLSTTSIDGLIAAFEGAATDVTEAATTMVDGAVDAIEGGETDAGLAAEGVAGAVEDGLSSADGSGAGQWVVDGFVGAIAAGTSAAADAGSALGQAALKAAMAALDENSPSKEMYKVGDFAVVGFVNAFKDGMSTSYNASYDTANEAIDGMSSAMSRIQDVINGDVDMNPTIRPVLDLSDVTSGTNAINRMLGMSPSMRTMADIGTINTMMNRNQNGRNKDVIDAINDLGNHLGNASGDTYNVNGITYDDGSNVSNTVRDLLRAVRIERRI